MSILTRVMRYDSCMISSTILGGIFPLHVLAMTWLDPTQRTSHPFSDEKSHRYGHMTHWVGMDMELG